MSTKLIHPIPPNRNINKVIMDISLSNKREGTLIEPTSVHGMLWLQTHFEATHWETISNGLAIIPTKDGEMLSEDAKNAGININFINSLSHLDII